MKPHKHLSAILPLLLLLAAIPVRPVCAAERPYVTADLSWPRPDKDQRTTANLGLGYGGGSGDTYRSSEAGISAHLGLGFPISSTGQLRLLGYLQKIGHTGTSASVTMYGLDFLYGSPSRAVVTGRSHGYFEGGLGFAGNVGHGKSGDVLVSLRGGFLVPVGQGRALELGLSVRPSLMVLMNMLGAEEPTGVLLGLEMGLVF